MTCRRMADRPSAIGRFVYDATMHSADKRERSAIMARKISIAILREREMRIHRFIPRANLAAEQTKDLLAVPGSKLLDNSIHYKSNVAI